MSAAAAAERSSTQETPFFFNPMNSRERRVIHMALRGETELRSESAGVGGHRLVVVYPAGMASVPPPPHRRLRHRRETGIAIGADGIVGARAGVARVAVETATTAGPIVHAGHSAEASTDKITRYDRRDFDAAR